MTSHCELNAPSEKEGWLIEKSFLSGEIKCKRGANNRFHPFDLNPRALQTTKKWRYLWIFANGVTKRNLAESDALFYRLEESSWGFQVVIHQMNLIKNTNVKPCIAWLLIDGIFEYKKSKGIFQREMWLVWGHLSIHFFNFTHSQSLLWEVSHVQWMRP